MWQTLGMAGEYRGHVGGQRVRIAPNGYSTLPMGVRTLSGASLRHDLALPNRYRIARLIAAGGMASVWCAEDLVLGRRVAIKLLAEQFVHDDRAVRRFEREARAAAQLSSHPHVVTIYDVGQTEPLGATAARRPFIVMEELTGGTVADALRAGAMTPEDSLRWVREAAAALDYAHRRGVIHRDIKPGNLLLDRKQRLHVADFGIARIGTEQTITGAGQLLGTAAYLSPEQALGRPATEASDRYALAVIAFELLVGERPFLAQHFATQARQHIDEEPPLASRRNQTLPEAVDPVLGRGLAKRPEERWATAGAFAGALERAAGAVGAGAGAPAEPEARPLVAAVRTPVKLGARPRAAVVQTPVKPGVRPRSAAVRAPVKLGARPRAAVVRTPVKPGLRSRAVALVALAAAAFGVGAATGAGTDHTPAPVHAVAHARSPAKRAASVPRRAPVHVRKQRPRAAPASHHANRSALHNNAVPAPAPAPAPPPPTSDALQARAHQLMQEGNYPAAIGVLRQAIATAAPGGLAYTYALFDLGRSLRLAGDPRAAVPILWKRLQIPNQTSVVRYQLELALRTLGAEARASGGATTAPPAARREHGAHGHPGGGGH
jgi:eukaryotic-like serine/threonine-protein kinase